MGGAKKLMLVAGGALLFAQQTGLLDDFLNPPEDPEDVSDDEFDDTDPDDRNPLGDLAANLLTSLGMTAAEKLLDKAMKKKAKATAKKNPASASKAKASVKPKVAAGVKPATTKAATSAATKATTKATEKAVGKAATQAVEKSGVKAASNAATKAGTTAATTATKAAGPAAKSAAKAAKGSTMLSKLKGTPADLIVMVIAQVLMAVLDLDPDSFKACESGEFDLGSLPDWANAMIGMIPFLGDLFDLIGNKMCLKAGCPKEAPDESGGLCYKPCDPGFKSDGAIMCYKQYPEFESNGMGHTITSITKKILMDTGRVPSACGDDEDKVGLLCYEKAPENWINVAGTIWQTCPSGFTDTGIRCENNQDVGAGRLPALSDCPAGWTNDGLTCREPITMSSCPGGWKDDGLTCREEIRCDPVRWDGCCSRGLFGECYGCARGGDCHGGAVKAKTLSGGKIETRFLKGPGDYEERIDGLNYNKCPDGFSRVPGMPYLCTKSFTKQSRVLGPRPMKCPMKPAEKENVCEQVIDVEAYADQNGDVKAAFGGNTEGIRQHALIDAPKEGRKVPMKMVCNEKAGQPVRETDIAGLCYSDIPKGYSRKALGTLDQDCPPGSTDFGVGCTRQSYSRGAGLIPLGIKFKDRK